MIEKHTKKYNFLVADDEYSILKIVTDILSIHPSTISIFTAMDGEKALEIYKNNQIDIVITDILMPKLTGLELIKKLKEINNEVYIIIISSFSNIELVREAIRNGAYDYILKPFSVDELMFSINRVIDRLNVVEEKKNYIKQLEYQLKECMDNIHNYNSQVINSLLTAIQEKNNYTFIHSKNLSDLIENFAIKIGLEKERQNAIKFGALLHDIGKIGIPDIILNKTQALDLNEWDIIKKHPIIGKNIVTPLTFLDKEIINIITYHHERIDGNGYPEGLKGDKIPLSARIVSIVNAYEVMYNGCIYKPKMLKEQILEEFCKNSGSQFDPELIKIFTTII